MFKYKIYFPPHLLFDSHRNSLFELLKSKFRLSETKKPVDVAIQNILQWVETPEEALFWVLPHDWSVYYSNPLWMSQALDFCSAAEKTGKTVMSFSGGDQGITVPVSNNCLVYRQSGYRSNRRSNERTAPFFLSDPIEFFIPESEKDVLQRPLGEKPIVGFCGMAPHGLVTEIKERLQVFVKNAKTIIGKSPFDQQEILSSSNLRYQTLQTFADSADFTTNYLIRQKYRGGEQSPENRKKTTDEYYANQVQSDLIICVRGVGNFSLRFFETLAMGRIPIFIDTDSPLPEIEGDWNDFIIWVDRNEVHQAPEIARAWLQNKNIQVQFQKNRALWLREFRLDNFWRHQLERLTKY
jgi:hypothetical protein